VRVAFYALLLVNLLYMAWAQWIDVPEPPAPSSIAKLPPLKLLSDLPPANRTALASKMSLETPAPPVCVSVGPFDDSAITAKAANLLLGKGFAPQQRVVESPAVRRLWVYLDQFRSDATEMRVLRRLEQAGIDDAEAMPAAAGGRKVSLGLFTDNTRAQSRLKAVRAMGFHPLTAVRVLPGTVYWLDLTLPNSSTSVPLKDVSGLQPGGGSSAISVQPCASARSVAAPAPRTGSPATASKAPPAPVPRAAPPAAALSEVPNLPRCKPGGGGPVPCVASEPKKATDASVL
jgi:hypothetical protein